MIEILSGVVISAAKIGSPNTAADHMEESGLVGRGDLAACIGHAASVAKGEPGGNRKIARNGVRFWLGLLGVLDRCLSIGAYGYVEQNPLLMIDELGLSGRVRALMFLACEAAGTIDDAVNSWKRKRRRGCQSERFQNSFMASRACAQATQSCLDGAKFSLGQNGSFSQCGFDTCRENAEDECQKGQQRILIDFQSCMSNIGPDLINLDSNRRAPVR